MIFVFVLRSSTFYATARNLHRELNILILLHIQLYYEFEISGFAITQALSTLAFFLRHPCFFFFNFSPLNYPWLSTYLSFCCVDVRLLFLFHRNYPTNAGDSPNISLPSFGEGWTVEKFFNSSASMTKPTFCFNLFFIVCFVKIGCSH